MNPYIIHNKHRKHMKFVNLKNISSLKFDGGNIPKKKRLLLCLILFSVNNSL